MKYPQEFADKVKEISPSPLTEGWLRQGSDMIGQILNSKRDQQFDADTIIKAIESGDTSKLLADAKHVQQADALYSEWFELCKTQRTQAPRRGGR